MTKRGRRGDLMERELLKSAAELFGHKGFGGTTLRDIADKAGVGRTTLYYYFASKSEILSALVEDQTTQSYRELRAIRERTDLTPRQKLSDATMALAMRVLEQPARFRVVEREEANLPPDMLRQQKLTRRHALNELIDIIENGIKAGDMRVTDTHLAALSIFGMCNWPAWWFDPKGPKPASEVALQIAAFAVTSLTHEGSNSKDTPGSIIQSLRADIDRLNQMIS